MTYTWDIENIMAVAARLEAEKANIDRQRRELEKYRSKTAGVFQGEAGTQFAENLDTDISNMHLVSEMIDGQVCRLRNIAQKHYGECESILRTKMMDVVSRMR